MAEFLRPLVSALLVVATFLILDRSGVLKGKPFISRALILLPAFAVVLVLFDMVWPA